MASSELNPQGFFESDPIYRLHEELMTSSGTSWDDLAAVPDGWLSSAAATDFVGKMVQLVSTEFNDSPLFVLKDPRLCRLVPFWIRVFEAMDVTPKFVHPVRHPREVAASLRKAQGVPEEKGQLLWLQHFLLAERDSRGQSRTFVAYDQLLADWRAVMRRVSLDLDLTFSKLSLKKEIEVDAFLDTRLRRHHEEPDSFEVRADVVDWVRVAYEWACRAVAGEAVDSAELDEITKTYLAGGRAFGPIVASAESAGRVNAEKIERLGQIIENATTHSAELEHQIQQLASAQTDLTKQLSLEESRRKLLQQQLSTREKLADDLVGCIKLMLLESAEANSTGDASDERLDSIIEALDSAEVDELPKLAAISVERVKNAQLQKELKLRTEDLNRLRIESDRGADRLAAHEETLRRQDEKGLEREAEVNRLAQELGSAQEEIAQFANVERVKNAQLQKELKLRTEDLNRLRIESDRGADRLAAHEETLRRQDEKGLEREAEVNRLAQELGSAQEEIARLANTADDVHLLRQVIEGHVNRLADLEAIHEKEADQLIAQGQQVRDLQEKQTEWQRQVNRLSEDLTSSHSNIDRLQQASKNQDQRLKEERARHVGVIQCLSTRESQILELEKSRDERATELACQSEALSEAHGEIQRVHGLLQQARRALDPSIESSSKD